MAQTDGNDGNGGNEGDGNEVDGNGDGNFGIDGNGNLVGWQSKEMGSCPDWGTTCLLNLPPVVIPFLIGIFAYLKKSRF